MKVYTKTGDKGETSLFGGKRVPKNNKRIEAYGTCDELIAFLGRSRDELPKILNSDNQLLHQIQSEVFSISAHLANEDPDSKFLPELSQSLIEKIENRIDDIQKELPVLKNFIIPGGCAESSMLHIARTVCRRAERMVVSLEANEVPQLPHMIMVLNRTSDYLFVLSRMVTKVCGGEEDIWLPIKK
jgi:cob(I)alamin adenosyltransferase